MYTPEFSYTEGVTIRRLAWGLGIPMTKALKEVIALLPSLFSPSLICPKCKDNSKCEYCSFNKQSAAENAALSALGG